MVDLSLTPDLDVPATDALIELDRRLPHARQPALAGGLIPPVRSRLLGTGIAEQTGNEHLFDTATVALIAYLNLHSDTGVDTRQAALEDLLTFIDSRRPHPGLDKQGHNTLDQLADQDPSQARSGHRREPTEGPRLGSRHHLSRFYPETAAA